MTVSAGGFVSFGGGVVSGLNVLAGGAISLDISTPGARIIGLETTANSVVEGELEGGLRVSGGVLVNSTSQFIDDGHAIDIVVEGGAVQTLNGESSSQALTLGSILQGGIQYVYNGIARRTIVSSGGRLFEDGGSATATTISNGGSGVIDAYGSATGLVIDSGGVVSVASGGTAGGIVVNSGGLLVVEVGADVSGVTLHRGGIEAIDTEVVSQSTVTGAVVSNGATQTVDFGGLAISTTVSSGSEQDVYGRVRDTTLTGSAGPGFESVGLQFVEYGGYSIGATIASGGDVEFMGGGSGGAVTVLSGGRLAVSSGAVVSGIIVSSGGTIVEWTDSQISGLTLKAGAIMIHDEVITAGTTSNVYVSSGAAIEVEATAIGTLVASGGVLENDFGVTSGTRVMGGGYEDIFAGKDFDATLTGARATVNAPAEYGCQLVEGVDTIAQDTHVASGGWQEVSGLGKASQTTATSGGVVEVGINGMLLSATLTSGSELIISNAANVVDLSLRAGVEIDLRTVSATATQIVSGTDLEFTNDGLVMQSINITALSTKTCVHLAKRRRRRHGSTCLLGGRAGAAELPVDPCRGRLCERRRRPFLAPTPPGASAEEAAQLTALAGHGLNPSAAS